MVIGVGILKGVRDEFVAHKTNGYGRLGSYLYRIDFHPHGNGPHIPQGVA